MAEDVMDQNIVIIPSKDLIIVRVANETTGHMDLVKFLTMILEAIIPHAEKTSLIHGHNMP